MSRRLIDVFPADDQLALFIVVMCAAANDVHESDHAARRANPQDDGGDQHLTHRTRFTYLVRRAMAHLFEAIACFKRWRQEEDEVRRLLSSLSDAGRENLKIVSGVEQRIGPDALGMARHVSSHYPSPGTDWEPDPVGEIAEAIRVNPDHEPGYDLIVSEVPDGVKQPPDRRLYRFGDQMMLSMALGGLDPDPEAASVQMEQIRKASEAFCALVDELFDIYCKRRGIGASEVV